MGGDALFGGNEWDLQFVLQSAMQHSQHTYFNLIPWAKGFVVRVDTHFRIYRGQKQNSRI